MRKLIFLNRSNSSNTLAVGNKLLKESSFKTFESLRNKTIPSNNNSYMKNYFSTNVKNNSSSLSTPSEYISSVKYKQWSKSQVYSLLCMDDRSGGACLNSQNIKSLHEDQFASISIGVIVELLKDYNFTFDEICRSFPNISPSLLTTIVFWVDNLYETRLYYLWSETKLITELCKPIRNGGAGLSENEYSPFFKAKINGEVLYQLYNELSEIETEPNFENYWEEALEDILSNYGVSYTNNMPETWKKIKNYILKKQIVFSPFLLKVFDENVFPSFSFEQKEKLVKADMLLYNKIDSKSKTLTQEEKNWYISFANLVLKGQDHIEFKFYYRIELEQLMNEAMKLLPNSNQSSSLSNDSFNMNLHDLKKLLEKEWRLPDIFM